MEGMALKGMLGPNFLSLFLFANQSFLNKTLQAPAEIHHISQGPKQTWPRDQEPKSIFLLHKFF